MNEDEVLLTPREVAERLQVKPSWVYRHARELGGYRVGKYVRFLWTRVLKAISDGASPAEPPPTR